MCDRYVPCSEDYDCGAGDGDAPSCEELIKQKRMEATPSNRESEGVQR